EVLCRADPDLREVRGVIPGPPPHNVTSTDSKAEGESTTGRTGCLNWARPDLREVRGVIPGPTRPYLPTTIWDGTPICLPSHLAPFADKCSFNKTPTGLHLLTLRLVFHRA